jgi:predicted thioesterase
MQTIFKALLVGTILAIGTGTAVAADAAAGTWKLNLGKSTFSPGPAPKSQTRIYAESAQGMTVTVTVKTTAADGKESTTNLTFKEDGKPYPASGTPDFDMVSVVRVDALTIHSTQMKAGATIGTAVRSVSKDGKTLTFSQKGTHAGGGKYDDVSVYDRQ